MQIEALVPPESGGVAPGSFRLLVDHQLAALAVGRRRRLLLMLLVHQEAGGGLVAAKDAAGGATRCLLADLVQALGEMLETTRAVLRVIWRVLSKMVG